MDSQDLDWLQKTYYKDYEADNASSQNSPPQNQNSPPPLTMIVGKSTTDTSSSKRNKTRNDILAASINVLSSLDTCDTQKFQNNVDSQDLDFQDEVTCSFDSGPIDSVFMDPGRISPRHYKKSSTLTQKHLPPPPLNLLKETCKSILSLSTNTKVRINRKETSTSNNGSNKACLPSTSATHTAPSTSHNLITSDATPASCSCNGEIKKIHNKLDQITYLIKDLSNRIVFQNGKYNSVANTEINKLFPLKNLKELEELEARCINNEFREQLVNYLSTFVNIGKGVSVALKKL